METYRYLGIFEADTIKYAEMKEKIKKENLKRTRKPNYIAEILSNG